MTGFRALHLDDITELPVLGGALRWKPVRRELDVRAFGTNAYAADNGQLVVEAHDESRDGGGGHQEMYVVVRGTAHFRVGDEEFDAPAGTIVWLPDPPVRREAVAAEDGTLVLAVGGEPGRVFEVSSWEHYFVAQTHADKGDFDKAAEICTAALSEHEGDPSLHYNLACYLAQAGRHDEAVGHLRRALDAAPEKVPRWAKDDTDLDSLRDSPDWPLT